MKKIIILSFLIMTIKGYSKMNMQIDGLLSVSTPTYSQVNKVKGGLFGYRSVSAGNDTRGNYIVNCSNPGTKKCVAAIVVNNTPLPLEECDAIDKAVYSLITSDNTSGTTLYKEVYVIAYIYDVDSNKLTYSVYSLDSARENGITW